VAVLVAVLVAAWAHAIMSHFEELRHVPDEPMAAPMLMAMIGVIAALFRWGIYVNGHASPITLRGRFWTGRWIVPNHDGPFWAALTLPLISGTTQAFLEGWPLMNSLPVSFSVMLLAAMILPPNRRRWQLTGEHRMVYLRRPGNIVSDT